MCRQCTISATEQIRQAREVLGYTFAGPKNATSMSVMKHIDTYIQKNVCKHWTRTHTPCYMNAAKICLEQYRKPVFIAAYNKLGYCGYNTSYNIAREIWSQVHETASWDIIYQYVKDKMIGAAG